MKLRELAYLVALADHGSFRRAAAALGVAQPTMSVQVRKLEEELGADLVDRSVTPLQFTAAGEVAVGRARALLREADELQRAVAAVAAPGGGSLRLGVFPTLGAYLLPRVLGQVGERFPELNLLITEEKTDDLIDEFHGGRLDAMLIALPVDLPGTTVRPLFREQFLFATAADGPLAGGDPVAAGELVDTDMLLLGEGHCLARQVEGWLDDFGVHRRVDHRASSLESLRSMVGAGIGSTLLPALSVESPSAGVVARPIVEPVPTRDIALVWRTGSPRAELLDELGDALIPRDAALVEPLP